MTDDMQQPRREDQLESPEPGVGPTDEEPVELPSREAMSVIGGGLSGGGAFPDLDPLGTPDSGYTTPGGMPKG